jgi:hypothetical protein
MTKSSSKPFEGNSTCEIISNEQSAFVPRQLIRDDIISTYECLDFMKMKRRSFVNGLPTDIPQV